MCVKFALLYHRVTLLENRVLRKIFGIKKRDVTRGWRTFA